MPKATRVTGSPSTQGATLSSSSVTIRTPQDVTTLRLKILSPVRLAKRAVRVDIVARTLDGTVVPVGNWPIYRATGVPSKFLPASDGPGAVGVAPLVLPQGELDVEIRMSGNSIPHWDDWTLFAHGSSNTVNRSDLWRITLGAL